MPTDEETTEYNLRLDASQMLQAIAEVNSKATSIPESLNNINLALDQFAKKYGISLMSAQKEMAVTISTAEKLRKMLESVDAPSTMLSPNAAAIAKTPNPFEQMGMSTQGGLQALNDQRKEGIVLTGQEARSEAMVAKEINSAKVAEEQKLAVTRQNIMLKQQEKKAYVYQNLAGTDGPDDKFLADLKQRQTASEGLQEENRKLLEQADEVGKKSQMAGEAGERGANRANFATRAWSIAVGMLIHQGINLLITSLQSMFSMAIKGLRELETATFNLVNAERNLSNQGINITPQGLDESIKNLQKLDPLLSKIQATEAVSRVSSLVAPAVGFNAKEIDQMTQAIAVLAIKNKGLGKSFEEVESQVSNAFLSGKVSVGINQLGVKITEQIVKDEALRMGLVGTADEYDKLSGKMLANVKARAMLSVVTQSTNKDMASLPQFFDTVDAKITIFQSRLQDFFTSLGTAFAPMLSRILDYLITALQNGIIWIEKNKGSLLLLADILGNVVVIVLKLAGAILSFGLAASSAFKNGLESLQKFIDKTEWLKKLVQSLGFKGIGDYKDTPPGPPGGGEGASKYGARYSEAVADAEKKVTEIMKDARYKREDMERNFQEKMADLARDYGRKLADITRHTADKTTDAQKDYGDKVRDINASIDKKIAETKQESYKKAVDAEKKYQDELKNLREKYLMDLEEALHARDARAILKLMQQYQFDKNKAVEKRNEEQQQAKVETAQKLKDLEQERKDKLAAAQKDLADKLKQIQIAAARERRDAQIAHQQALADARTAYQRQLAEQRLFLQRKLADLAAAIASEYQLTAAGQAAINALIAGAGGAGITPTTSSTYTSATPTTSPLWANTSMYGTGGGLAEGGTFVATRPGTINVAETRPEIITATPLGKPGKDIGKVFSNAGGGGMGDGKIEIGMTLSPDLEARIISQTLSETANVVLKINRSKQ